MREVLKKSVIAVVILMLLCGPWLFVEYRCASELHAPLGLSVSEFLASRPKPRSIARFNHAGAVHFRVVGALCSGPFKGLRSGPPEYVFSASGGLVDMCLDPDDPSKFYARWSGFVGSVEMSVEQVVHLAAEHDGGIK
jgi:hypothetical protein